MSTTGRIAAAVAAAGALMLLALVLLAGDDRYEVRARFQAATQMVEGNLVQVGGRPVGLVKQIELTRDGEAELRLEIDDEFAPLREGTQATIRTASLSGVVNRYVDLRIPPARGSRERSIPESGLIPSSRTTSAVDLDQLFSLFDDKTKKGLTEVIRGSAAQYAGRGEQQNAAWRYLNPSLVGATRLFDEINRDSPLLERFVVESSKLVTDVADRRDDLGLLVDRLATTTGALAREERSLSAAIGELPPFMRRANSAFVDLRSTLDVLDPLVAESKPVTPKLRAMLAQLRPFARDAKPTVRDLAALVRRRGEDNDLIELGRRTLPFRDIAIKPVQRNGKKRPGSFETTTRSLAGQAPHLAFFRPYSVDFTGWLDDFSHSGVYDANGSASRSATSVNAFAAIDGQLRPVPPELRDELFSATTERKQNSRCPGSAERGSVFKPSPDFKCDETQVPPGR
ncbi:MAG: MCE family protein [Solirubrobacterales bacterium]|nr:MCE family protein [Solirubrobacterales bacterium]